MNQSIQVMKGSSGQRLDIFCAHEAPEYSRSKLQQAIRAGQITVNDKVVKPNHALREGDRISVDITADKTAQEPTAVPANVEIIYKDKDVLVINKPAGVLTHATSTSRAPTVTSWFLKHCPQAKNVGEDPARPGVVHRLDKDTSGILILAKTEEAFEHLKAQFKKRHAKKEYLALVHGTPSGDDGRINQAIARSPRNPNRRMIGAGLPSEAPRAKLGKPAITEWKVEQQFPKYTLVRLLPFTGRTHQLRVHMHFIGHPIVGDSLYTFKRQKPPSGVVRQLLHAEKLTLRLPSGKRKTFTAPLPTDFQAILNTLKPSHTSEV